MKILIINSFFGPFGGAEVVAYETYKLLNKDKHDVYFYSTDRKPYFDSNYKYQYLFPKDKFTTIGYIKNPLRYYYDYNAQKKLTTLIQEIKPDLIHCHNVLALSPYILRCCRDIPTVLTIHQADICCPASTLMKKNKYFCENLDCQKKHFISCILNNCVRNNLEASIRRSLLIYLYTKNLKYIDKFITPSNALRQQVIKANLGIKEEQIITIPNFLTEDQIKTIPNYSNKGYFLYIGRLSKEKNVISLLKAMNELPREINLHIVGTGSEEEILKEYVQKHQLRNVSFLGFKKGLESLTEYQNCIATILPCNWFEIFGMTNIESFINGKPVIASNIGGIPEIVEQNVNGLLFEPANVEQLKECILTYWNNPELVVEHGKNGYQKAITQYTERKYYNELMKVYEDVIDEFKK